MKTVYLAGPTVFLPEPGPVFAAMKAICARHGLQGVSPLDNQMGLQGVAPGPALARAVVQADIALMRQVDAGVFCLDGFRRGPEMDPGTAFEIGYMHALGKPLAGWTRETEDYPERVRRYFAEVFGQALVAQDTSPDRGSDDPAGEGARSGLLRDPDGVLVHSEGCWQNAMTQMGIELSGGAVHGDAAWEQAFGRAVAALAAMLGRTEAEKSQ